MTTSRTLHLPLLNIHDERTIMEKIDSEKTPIWKYWGEFIELSLTFWKSPVTLSCVRQTILFFLRYSELNTIESWFDIMQVSKVLAQLKTERSWSPVTLNSHRKAMNTYFLFLLRFWYIKENPIMKIIKMPEPSKNMPTLTDTDIKALLGQLLYRSSASEFERLRNILFVKIAIVTGARPKELLALTSESINDTRTKIRINGAKQKWKERYYELNQSIRETLSSYLKESVRLGRFYELKNGLFLSSKERWVRWTYSGVNKLFQRVSAELWKPYSVYMIRRYACTELFARNVPIQNIQLFMGQNRLATTYRYNNNSTRNTKDCTDILWKF